MSQANMFVFSLHSAKNREEKPTETSEDWKMFTGPFVHQSYFILCKNEQNILLPWRKENTCPGYEIRPDSILATERAKELSHFYHVNRRKQESKQMLNLLNLIWVCFSSSAFFSFLFFLHFSALVLPLWDLDIIIFLSVIYIICYANCSIYSFHTIRRHWYVNLFSKCGSVSSFFLAHHFKNHSAPCWSGDPEQAEVVLNQIQSGYFCSIPAFGIIELRKPR